MVTLKDVARDSGVSVGTVSAVLNNKIGPIKVRDTTRSRIKRIARELKYTPNVAARGLRTGKSYLLGVIVGDISTPHIAEYIEGIERIAEAQSYGLLLSTYSDIGDFLLRVDMMRKKNVDGVITVADPREEYKQPYLNIKEWKPLVFIANKVEGVDVPSVMVDGNMIGYLATKHLLELGHRKIMLALRRDNLPGYRKALNEFGVEFRDDFILDEASSFEKGVSCFESIRKGGFPVSAVVANSDKFAAGIIAGAYAVGERIPDCLSVVGSDDLSIARMTTPAITTVAQPLLEQGEAAARQIFEMINGVKPGDLLLDPWLVERGSCAAFANQELKC